MKLSIAQSFLISLVLLIISIVLIVPVAIAAPLSPGMVFLAQANDVSPNPSPIKPPDYLAPDYVAPSGEAKDKAAENPDFSPKSPEDPPDFAQQDHRKIQSEGPYDMKAIEEFYKALYGS